MSLLFLGILTGNVCANAGTPLIITGGLYLLLGNFFIGIFEGFLLIRIFHIRKFSPIPVMVLANYASAWAAVGLSGMGYPGTDVIDIANVRTWFLVLMVAAWLFTVFVEWPFIRYCFRGEQRAWRRSFTASLVIQSVSYLIMIGLFWTVSGTSLLTSVTVVDPAELPLPTSVNIYYINPTDGGVYRRPIRGGGANKVFDLNSRSRYDQLFAVPDAGDGTHAALLARMRDPERTVEVLAGLAAKADDVPNEHRDTDSWFNFGHAAGLGVTENEKWKFETGFWAAEGLTAVNQGTGEKINVSMETPSCMWYVRNAIQLSSDLVLFQLGEDQICVFDPTKRRISYLWRGRGFTAMIPQQ